LRPDHRAIADMEVIENPHLTQQCDIVPDSSTASNTHLSSDDRILSHNHIVGNLHKIVDFGAPADDRFP
jgi:hypothetical protein